MLPFKRLIQTNTAMATFPLMLARMALGLFFFASGFNKLFVPENQMLMLETLTDAGIPFPAIMAVFVAACECVLGLTMALGLLTRLSALVLFIISTVALLTVGIHTIPGGINLLTWYSWLLYLPEPLYMLICLMLMIEGGVRFSVDGWLMKRGLNARKIVFVH